MGVAKFIKENCVVYTDTNCGACSEHCPTKAVHMKPYLNAVGRKLVIPEVDKTICVGGGGCEHACPTKPFKAIYVDGNPKHKTAQKPKEKKYRWMLVRISFLNKMGLYLKYLTRTLIASVIQCILEKE